MALVKIENLSFQYPLKERKVLQDITLSIEEGEFVVVCGVSGCGKSTLLKQLKREIAPHGKKTGAVFYNDVLLDELDQRTAAAEIGFVMQNPENQIVTDKVWHELAFGLENLGLKTTEIRRKVAEMANYFGIQQWFRKKTTELSGGQKQLLNLAAIMVMQPKVLILDEPTSQLDPIAAVEFISTLQKLNKELGLTIILVEHRLEEVYAIADRVVVMEEGKIVCNDKPRTVAQQLKEQKRHQPMMLGLPTPVRVFNQLSIESDSPLTVREGRKWLKDYFRNETKVVQQSREENERGNVLLEVKETWFRYERDLPDILRGFAIQIRAGEIFSIVGGNGTGKTTALKVMAGLYKPYRGKIILDGKKLTKYKNGELYRNNLAVLPQDPQTLFVENKVEKELKKMVQKEKYSDEEAEKRIADIIATLQIEHLLESHPYDLSGGEQQKVALAKILLSNPRIIFLDEPTKGIDAESKRIFADILRGLKGQGVAIVMVTHDIEFSAEHSDRCAMFFDGGIVSEDITQLFYSGNNFYTTAAHRMSKHMFEDAVTCEDVIHLCRASLING